MRAVERETQRGVRCGSERHGFPPLDRMTGCARAAIGPVHQLAAVRVAVAVGAPCRRHPDRHGGGGRRPPSWHVGTGGVRQPRRRRSGGMARRAGHRGVAAEQRERGAAVLGDRERRRREPIDAMARRAVDRLSGDGRLAVMRVAVTRCTGREPRAGDAARRAAMAGCARHVRVATTQRIPRSIVIECRAVDRLEARRHVALRARSREAALVWARVTAGAVLEGDRAEHRRRSPRGVRRRTESRGQMALGARDVAVLAGERIVRLRVIERRRVLPSPRVVTPRAGARERAAVRVRVTARAVPLEPDPAGTGPSWREGRHRRRAKSRRMARGTLRRRVTLFQRVAGAARVVEALWRTAGPLDELEVATRVIGMTRRARPLPGTACMEPALLLAQPRDLLVTR